VAAIIIIKENLWDIKIKDTYKGDTIISEFLKNLRENFIIEKGFLLFRG
jgi:hypothetical protein